MKNKNLTILIVLMLLGAFFLTACGGGDDAETPEETTTEETSSEESSSEEAMEEESSEESEEAMEEMAGPSGTVTLWHAYGTGSAEEDAMTAIVENARAEYPDLTIEVLQIPFDQIFNKWQTEVAAGEGPDMFIAPNDDLGNMARAGLVLDITDHLEGRLDDVVDTGVAGMEVNGRLYGVPESAKAVALYYNKSMVDAPPTTAEELLAAVQDGNALIQNQNAYHLFGWWSAFGGEILSADGTVACPSGEEGFVEAMQFQLDLKDAGAQFETDGGRADSLFRNGEVAMIINGPWTLGDYRTDLGDDLGVAPIPAGSAPAGALNGIDGFYINPNSGNADSAIELALFLSSGEQAQMYTDMAGHVPIRPSVTIADANVAGFAEASNVGTPRPQTASFGNYWGPFGDMVTKVIEGVATPEEGVAEACENFQNAIAGIEPEPVVEEEAEEEMAEEAMTEDVELLPGTVTLWHAYGTGSAEEDAMTAIVAMAQEANPDLTVEVLQIPFDQIFNKWQTEVAAGEGPDMFIAPNDDLGNMARAGLVLDITSQLEGKLDGVVDTGVAGMMVDGAMYGVPESAKAVALYYNKSMVDTPPTTTEELLAAVQDGNALIQNQNAYHLFGWWSAFGGEVLSADGTTACPSGEEPIVNAMQYLLDIKDAGGQFETDGGRADSLFRNGEVPMIINGPWTLGDYRADLGDDLGVAPIPAGVAPAGALNGIDGFYINPNSGNVDAAVALALFLSSGERAQAYTDMAGHVPIRTSVNIEDANVAGFAEASNVGTPRPQSASFGNYWGPFGDMVTKVIEGVATPEEGVAEACGNYQSAIDGQ